MIIKPAHNACDADGVMAHPSSQEQTSQFLRAYSADIENHSGYGNIVNDREPLLPPILWPLNVSCIFCLGF